MGNAHDNLLGRVAVKTGLLTMEQLAEATREQGQPGQTKNLGSILVDKGFLTPEGLERVVQVQKNVLAKAKAKQAGDVSAVHLAPSPAVEAAPAEAMPEPPPLEHTSYTAEPEPTRVSQPQALTIEHSGDTAQLDALLAKAVEAGASDIHIHGGAPIKFRVHGKLYDHDTMPADSEARAQMLLAALSKEDRQLFLDVGEHDFAYTLKGVGRFRCNFYQQLRGTDGVFRFIPEQAPSLEQLGLPSSLAKFTTFHQGMVLITGPTSCGKSSTMAALVNLINEERAEHILTIEDPIEYVHPSKRCLVNQRNVRRHTETFARALRAALREDPDVIVIGELRDQETIALALAAAETGHFVLGTLHTDNGIRTINRLVGAFPPDQQDQVRSMISESLRAVISQRLLPTADETSQIPALEIITVNRAVGNLIREAKVVQLRTLLQTSASADMRLLDNSLAELVTNGTITREEALKHAEEPKRIPGES